MDAYTNLLEKYKELLEMQVSLDEENQMLFEKVKALNSENERFFNLIFSKPLEEIYQKKWWKIKSN